MTAESVPTTAKQRVAQPHMSEDELLTAVLALAKLRGWRVAHFRPARTDKGWRTAVQGDAGFVDLVLARTGPGRAILTSNNRADYTIANMPSLLFVELKSDRGRISVEQKRWLEALGPYACVWRPAQWRDGTIERALR